MRKITMIIVHCTATEKGRYITAQDVDRYHKACGWKMIGYHYLVRLDGMIDNGRPESMTGAHCRGHNRHSIGVCYAGGLSDGKPADTRTAEQKVALLKLLKELKQRYPEAIILGHHDLNAMKACPCFDAVKDYRGL